jgi:hypothetical protein
LDSHIHTTTDAWSAPNHWAFVAIYVYYEEDGKVKKLLLDFIEAPFVSDLLR